MMSSSSTSESLSSEDRSAKISKPESTVIWSNEHNNENKRKWNREHDVCKSNLKNDDY